MTDAPLIPRQVLFGELARSGFSLSPSGTHLSFIAAHNGDLHVWLGNLKEQDFHPLPDLRGRPIEGYVWGRDGRHLLYCCENSRSSSCVVAVDLVSGRSHQVGELPGVDGRVVGLHSRSADRILVQTRQPEGAVHLHELELSTGEVEPVELTPGLSDWVADPELVIRAARRRNADGGFTIVVRDDAMAPWRPLLSVDYPDGTRTQLLGFAADGTHLLVLTPLNAETRRLVRLCCTTGDVQVLYADPDYDVDSVLVHPVTREVEIAVVERDRTVLEPLTPGAAEDVAKIRSVARGDVTVLGRDLTNQRWLLLDNADDHDARYLLMWRDTGDAEVVFRHNPGLAPYQLASMEPFTFTARDGLAIHGYLTFPPGQRHLLPTVLNVHGGPWDRSHWGLRGESQWLANRGYLCIEVNFRGSAGYGRAFTDAGDKEWGGRMQDDLMDAVSWAVAQGYTDADRVGIQGMSYGGYAALVGAAFTPDAFRCAIAMAAPTDLRSFIESIPGYWTPSGVQLRHRVGDPETDGELLWARSPLSRVADIKAPLLLAYGVKDGHVPVGEGEQLVEALRLHGIEHRYLLFPDEGHGLSKPENQATFYATAEEFLARHLGGRHECG